MGLISQHQRLYLVAIVAATALAMPSVAPAQQQRFTVRGTGTWSYPTGDFDFTAPTGQRLIATPSNALGVAFAFEYRPVPKVGFEFGGMFARPTIDLVSLEAGERVEAEGDMWFVPWIAGVNLHMTPDRPVDIYAGVMLLYALYGDVDFVAPGLGTAFVRGNNDTGWGMQLGVDVPIGEKGWNFAASIKYLSTNYSFTEVDEGLELEMRFNPFVLGFGVSAHF